MGLGDGGWGVELELGLGVGEGAAGETGRGKDGKGAGDRPPARTVGRPVGPGFGELPCAGNLARELPTAGGSRVRARAGTAAGGRPPRGGYARFGEARSG